MGLEFDEDTAYFKFNNIGAVDGSSQKCNETSMTKMCLRWFCQYQGSTVQELITMSNSACLD